MRRHRVGKSHKTRALARSVREADAAGGKPRATKRGGHKKAAPRSRAEARLRRRRGESGGEIGMATRTFLLGVTTLFTAGLLFGTAIGVYYDRVEYLLDRQNVEDLAAEQGELAEPRDVPVRLPSDPSEVAPEPQAEVAAMAPAPEPASTIESKPEDVAALLPAALERVAAAAVTRGAEARTTEQLAPSLEQVLEVAREALRRPEAEPDFEASEVVVVYEEPVQHVEHAPEPSPQALDSFVTEQGLATLERDVVPAAGAPQWQRNAVQVADAGTRPMIALVIDDLGLNRPNTRRSVALPGPLTLAFMTYAERLDGILSDARANGHELMVHMPMEPSSPDFDPGPRALLVDLPEREIAARLNWGLNRFEGYVGINNHMGSRFTTSLDGMSQVLAEVKRRGLLYLDSRTSGGSVGAGLAERMGVPYAERDVFIDNEPDDRAAIRQQLAKLEAVAREQGFAVGIGHPHKATLDVLEKWLPEARVRGFALVPISAVVRRRIELAAGSDRAG